MLKMSKAVKIVIVFLCLFVIISLSLYATKVVNKYGYDIKEIANSSESTKQTEATTFDYGRVDYRSIVSKDLGGLTRGKVSDEEYAVMRSLSVLMNSPMAQVVNAASYEVKLVGDEWVVKFSCSDYDLYVSCERDYFNPITFTCTRAFTQEEVDFFNSLGSAWEVQNEDGTYTIRYY